MKIPEPKNSNYAASIVEIKAVIPLENCDNVHAVSIFGFQGIVGKDVKVGDIGVVFPAETQLSDEFCYENNLYRNSINLEGVIKDIWSKKKKIVISTPIERLIVEECVKVAGLSTITKETQHTLKSAESLISSGEIKIKNILAERLKSGLKTTQKKLKPNVKDIEKDIPKTNELGEENYMTSPSKIHNLPKGSSEEIRLMPLPSTESQYSSMTKDILSWVDVVRYVEGGGKLSQLTTIIIQELLGGFSAQGVMYHLVGLAIIERVCKESSITLKELQAVYKKHSLNKDPSKKGYLEDNRRIKAVKFRGHRSDCLFMPLSSLDYLSVKESEFKVGMIFDTINEREICKKYQIREPIVRVNGQRKAKLFTRVDRKYIPEHFDTDNYFRVSDSIPDNAEVVVTQKTHGTSIIVGNTIVKRKLNPIEWLLKKVGVKIQENEFDNVYSSRRVIKDANNPDHKHFYLSDIWTLHGSKLNGIIPKNYIVYGELIGWTPEGAPIQTGYTYNQPQRQASIYLYRIAIVNEDGLVVDLTWDQVKEFCRNNGLSHVPELWRGFKKDFKPEDYMDRRYYDEGAKHCLPLSDKNTVDEGICVRIDGLRPYIAKCKAPKFFEFETKQLDKGKEDIESSENI